MSFSERQAWVMGFAILASTAAYFWLLTAQPGAEGGLPMPTLGVIIWTTVVAVVAAAVPMIVLAAAKPKEASMLPDEREQMIEAKAGTVGYITLQVALVAVFAVLFLTGSAADGFHALVGASALAGLAESGAQIWRHRSLG